MPTSENLGGLLWRDIYTMYLSSIINHPVVLVDSKLSSNFISSQWGKLSSGFTTNLNDTYPILYDCTLYIKIFQLILFNALASNLSIRCTNQPLLGTSRGNTLNLCRSLILIMLLVIIRNEKKFTLFPALFACKIYFL